MTQRIYLVPVWIRLWHWTNAALMLILTVSGASLHFASPDLPLMRFELAVQTHNMAGLSLLALYVFFVIANLVSGHWWEYVPKPQKFFERAWNQAQFYCFGVFVGAPHPYPPTLTAKFNVLQQITYWMIMYIFMPILLISGIMFMWPGLAPARILGYDGLLPVAVIHYLVGLVIVCFMVMHVYLGTMGHRPTSLFKTMITGWHEE